MAPSMFAHGAGVRALSEWYSVDQETIREVLKPHVHLVEAPSRGGGKAAAKK